MGSLVADPLIRTKVVAGSGGLARPVSWAHTCELTDPWNWMGEDELLMTDGYGFPAVPEAQIEFVNRLEAAGLAALMLADGFGAPPLTSEASSVADSMGFPILVTARSVPFVMISRLVAERNGARSASRASRVLRLYEVLRKSHLRELDHEDALLEHLGKELSARLHVVELRRGGELMPPQETLEPSLRAAIVAHAREHTHGLPGFSRFRQDSALVLLVPAGGVELGAALVVCPDGGADTDLVLLQHAAMIAGLEVERRAARASRARDRGAALMLSMVDNTITPEAAANQLEALGLGRGPWRVTAWQSSETSPLASGVASPFRSPMEELAADLARWSWAHVRTTAGDTHLIVVPSSHFPTSLLHDAELSAALVGVSQPFSSAGRVPDAVREARWALEEARTAEATCVEYATGGSFFLPRTVAEGETVVRRLLGAVIDYDREHNSELTHSLWVFFTVNRSWQEGARRLGIHKQTLVYRLKKIEELTGADLRGDFETQAQLYLALRTWNLLHPREAGRA